MDRREFMGGLLGAGAAIGGPVAAEDGEGATAQAFRTPRRGFTYRFLTNDRRYLDGRPCFSPNGEQVLFMRTPVDNPAVTTFWIVPTAGGQAVPFFEDPNLQSTRPDWSRVRRSFEIAFTGIDDQNRTGVYLLDSRTKDVASIPTPDPDGDIPSYPSWYPDGKSLVFTNYKPALHQIMWSDLVHPPVPLTDPSVIWAGMSSVSPDTRAGNPIVFAGQVPTVQPYDENTNQIWILQPGKQPFELDPGQGRAPWWSPDGRRVAFESNRPVSDQQHYRIFLQNGDAVGNQGATPITPFTMSVQHAKWSPSGRQIVFAAGFPVGGGGIAIVEPV